MNELDLSVLVARIDEKVDGINTRLDKLNGSVGRHDTEIFEIKTTLVKLTTEAGLVGKLVKPAGLILVVILSMLMGDATQIGGMLDFLNGSPQVQTAPIVP